MNIGHACSLDKNAPIGHGACKVISPTHTKQKALSVGWDQQTQATLPKDLVWAFVGDISTPKITTVVFMPVNKDFYIVSIFLLSMAKASATPLRQDTDLANRCCS